MTYRVKCDGCNTEATVTDAPGWFKLELLNLYAATNRGTDTVTIHLCPVCATAVRHDVQQAREHHAPITCRDKPGHPHYDDDPCPDCGVWVDTCRCPTLIDGYLPGD